MACDLFLVRLGGSERNRAASKSILIWTKSIFTVILD